MTHGPLQAWDAHGEKEDFSGFRPQPRVWGKRSKAGYGDDRRTISFPKHKNLQQIKYFKQDDSLKSLSNRETGGLCWDFLLHTGTETRFCQRQHKHQGGTRGGGLLSGHEAEETGGDRTETTPHQHGGPDRPKKMTLEGQGAHWDELQIKTPPASCRGGHPTSTGAK